MNIIQEEMIPIIFMIIIAIIIKILSDNRIRRMLIEKGMLSENIQYLFSNPFEKQTPSSLKWGMVLVAIGLAVLIGQFAPMKYGEEVTFSMMFILAGLALIIFYVVASRAVKQKQQLQKLDE
jgi:hypothetical protein